MDDRTDRLYDLLPAIYRQRDAEQGYPLKALLRVIATQVNVVEDWSSIMGSAHGIIIHPENGLRMGGADPRSDGAAIGY